MSASPGAFRLPIGIPGSVIALLLILGGMIGAFSACVPFPGPNSGNATATAQTIATSRAQSNTTATAQAQLNATATIQAQASATAQTQANGTATVQAQATITAGP